MEINFDARKSLQMAWPWIVAAALAGIAIGVLTWQTASQNVPAWAGMVLSWLGAMTIVWATLTMLTKGFSSTTSLDSYNDLLDVALDQARKNGAVEPGISMTLVAVAIRNGLLLVATGLIIWASLEYTHPMG